MAWTPTPPQPYPATYADEADVAAQRMKDNNPENSSSTEYDAAQTKVIAETCVWIAARLGTAKPSECGKRGLPIFVTAKQTPNLVSTAAATAHDIEAMTNPDFIKFLFQNYDQRAGRYKDAQSGWYSQLSNNPCAGLTGVGTGMDCDEFPFLATEQGGPWAWKTTGVHPSLKPVASGPNQAQGSKFGWFGTHCELSSGPERVAQELNAIGGQEFMFVPVDPEREVFTGYLCNPGAS